MGGPAGPDGAAGALGEVDVDELVRVVLAVPGVHDLHAGVIGEVATYLPGRRVNGLKLLQPGCDVHVVVEQGVPVLATADLVRAALRPLVAGPIDVTIEDVVPGSSLGSTPEPVVEPAGGSPERTADQPSS